MKRASKITSVTSRCQIKRRQSDNAKAGTTWIWLKDFLLLSKICPLSSLLALWNLLEFDQEIKAMDCLKKVLQIWCIYLRKIPPSTFADKKGSADNWICLLRSSTRQSLSQQHRHPRTKHIPCGNSFQRRVKYSRNVKTLRVEEIRPDPVKREGCLLEIASKVVISEICSNGQRWRCCCNFKDEMVAMAHYFSCCCCSRLLWSLQKTFQSLDFSSPRLFAFLRSFESLWWGISCGWSRKNPTLNCCDKCILKPFQTLILSSFWEFWKFRIKDHLKPINVKNKTFQQFYSLRKITNLAAKTF